MLYSNAKSLNCSAGFRPYIPPPPPAFEQGRVVFVRTRPFIFCIVSQWGRLVQISQGLSEAGPSFPWFKGALSRKLRFKIRTLICFLSRIPSLN
jgi:hypothetical protein